MTARAFNGSAQLKQRLTLQQETQTPDGAGGYARSWDNIADIWAQIMPISGQDHLRAMQLQAEVTHKIMIRYRGDVKAGMRFVFEGRNLLIRYVININEKKDYQEILAFESSLPW